MAFHWNFPCFLIWIPNNIKLIGECKHKIQSQRIYDKNVTFVFQICIIFKSLLGHLQLSSASMIHCCFIFIKLFVFMKHKNSDGYYQNTFTPARFNSRPEENRLVWCCGVYVWISKIRSKLKSEPAKQAFGPGFFWRHDIVCNYRALQDTMMTVGLLP